MMSCKRWLRRNVFAIAATFVLFAASAAPASAQEVERIAAVVNDKVISIYDLRQRIELLIFSAGLPNTNEQRRSMAPQVLRGLIDEALQTEEAQRLNIRVSQRDMDDAVGQIERANNIPEGQFEDMVNGLSAWGILDYRLPRYDKGIPHWEAEIYREEE